MFQAESEPLVLKKVWHDPVLSKVIAAGMCAAIPWFVNYLFHLWSWSVQFEKLRKVLGGTWAFLLSATPISHWLIGLGGLIVLLVVLMSMRSVVIAKGSQAEGRLDWYRYTTDIFFGIRWRWKYEPSGEPTNPICFCPRCDCQLLAHNVGAYSGIDRTAFHCVSCDATVEEIGESLENVEQKVSLLIQKNLRTGAWAGQVNDNSQIAR